MQSGILFFVIIMETARRLGSVVRGRALVLYIVFSQTDPGDVSLRGQLVVYTIIFGGLGMLLLVRYRSRAKRTASRFSWIRNFLFRPKSKQRNKKSRRSRRRQQREERAIGDEEPKDETT